MSRATTKAAKPAPRPAPKAVTPAAQRRAEAVAATQETTAYVVGNCPIQHDGVLYPVGADIPLTDAQAERLGDRVVAVAAAAPGQPTTLE